MTRILRVARCVAPALFIAVYTLLTVWTIASTQLGPRPSGGSNRIEPDVRFKGVRDELVARRVDTAGYVHDSRRQDPTLGRSAHFFWAQYALAPTIVRKSTSHRYVVVDFHSRRALEAYLERTALIPVARYGHGIALLRNDGAP